MTNKKIIVATLFSLLFFCTKAQTSSEIGIIGGVSYYLGDINQTTQFYSPNLAYGLIYRYSFNQRYALRANLLHTTLNADDQDFDNIYQHKRNFRFNKSLTELGALCEFNFFPFQIGDEENIFSPFISSGLVLFYAPETEPSTFQLALPFQLGAKFNIGERFSAGVEWAFRKTFTDYLDNLGDSNFPDYSIYRTKQMAYINHTDYYSYAAIFFTFKFLEPENKCKAYTSKKYKLK